jgi:PAS domain S-box-containing protein
MKRKGLSFGERFNRALARRGINLRSKLIIIFLAAEILPIVLLAFVAWNRVDVLGQSMTETAVKDASQALNDQAVENIERMSTDLAHAVASFLYERDADILYLASIEPTLESFRAFGAASIGQIIYDGQQALSDERSAREREERPVQAGEDVSSSNEENNIDEGFNYRPPDSFETYALPLYDEISFVGLDGTELVKYVSPDTTKSNYPMSSELRDVSDRENTYVKAETYFSELSGMEPGEIYVSGVIGAYVGTNYIGMYTPGRVKAAAYERGYDIEYDPEAQAYAGEENPGGRRFEGIIRWATPVAGEDGEKIGYVTFALNHDHLMEFTDHLTPMSERYIQVPSAHEGNYAFIWDYQCRSICHPRHHSIVGYDPETGLPQTPWLESSVYEAWQESGLDSWADFAADYPVFFEQSREKEPAPELTRAGLVGLDGRYLNNAPQMTGWMDLTEQGGSGSFYMLWMGINKLTAAAAIPYYTGQYAPSEANGFSQRGFGFVSIGSGLEDFTAAATDMEIKLVEAIDESQSNAALNYLGNVIIIVILFVLIALWMSLSITGRINKLIAGISRFRAGDRTFRFEDPVNDEFGKLADSFDDMAQSIVQSVQNPMIIVDMELRIIYMNEMGLNFCDSTFDEIVGTPYLDISVYKGDWASNPVEALEHGLEAEIIHVEKYGIYVRGTANHFLDKEERCIGYIIELADVTSMVLEQKRIEIQRSLLDKVLSSSPDLVWYMDDRGKYLTVNPRFASIAGLSPEDFIWHTALEMLPVGVAEVFNENDWKTIKASVSMYSEERVVFADGHEEILDCVRTPIYGLNWDLVGILGYARDVTVRVKIDEALRETQLELENAVSEANRANAHKGEFLARMSHEIRTPMNVIVGLSGIIQKKLVELRAQNADVRVISDHIDRIEASSQHLLGLLNDILDISKIEAGKVELVDDVVSLSKLIESVDLMIRPRCEDRSIRFTTNCEFEKEVFSLDSLRLRQVLINLLGNAVKFTPEGGAIDFSIRRLNSGNGFTRAEFVVRDTGIGIAEEDLSKIFEAFEQVGGNGGNNIGGTGLGLPISARIVSLFGGELKAESVINEGSVFSFAIWLRESEAALQDASHEYDTLVRLEGKRLLLVDDAAVNRLIIAAMLEDTGVSIEEAQDGVEALDMFRQSSVGYYDLILMDIQMPKLDGYGATEAIRALPREDAGSVAIVAQTANAFKEDINKVLAHGMNGHLAKPVDLAALLDIVYRFLK